VLISDWLHAGLGRTGAVPPSTPQAGAPYTYVVMLTALEEQGLNHGWHARRARMTTLTKPLNVDDLEARLVAAARVTALHHQLTGPGCRDVVSHWVGTTGHSGTGRSRGYMNSAPLNGRTKLLEKNACREIWCAGVRKRVEVELNASLISLISQRPDAQISAGSRAPLRQTGERHTCQPLGREPRNI